MNWARLLPKLRDYLSPEDLDNDDLAISPDSQRLLEEFRHDVQDAVMSSDLDDALKVKIFAMIRDVPLPLKVKNR